MRQIKVAVFGYYPMANRECKLPTWRVTNNCPMPGLGTELLKLMTDYLNWTIDAVPRAWSEYDEDHMDLINGTYDMYTLTFEKTKVREQFFDFSEHLYESTSRLIVKRADRSLNSIFDFFAVYNWQAWLVMGLALLFFIVIGALTRWVELKLALRSSIKVSELAWRMLRLQLIQYQGIDYRLMAGSFSLLVFAFLQVTIIISLYQSWIISSVVRSQNPYPFNLDDLPNLLRDGKYKFVSNDIHEWFMEEIEKSNESPYYEYRHKMPNGSFVLVKSEDAILAEVNKGNAITVEQDDIHLSFAMRTWCDLVHMPSPFHQMKKYFIFRKGNPIRDEINKAISAQRMMIERLHRKYMHFRQPSKCPTRTNMPKALSLTPYYGVFLVFMFGMGASCFVFGGEMVSKLCGIRRVHSKSKVDLP